MRLSRALARLGLSVAVIAPVTPRLRSDALVSDDGVTVLRVPHFDRLSLAVGLRPWRRRVRKLAAELAPDVVHGHGILDGGLPACDVTGAARIVTAHGSLRADTLIGSNRIGARLRSHVQTSLARAVVRRADAVVGVHPDWRVNLPASPRRLVHIPNIVEPCFFDVTPTPEPGRVLFCGGSRRIKGADLLLESWQTVRRAVPHAVLHVIGWPVAGDDFLHMRAPEIEVTPILPAPAFAAALARAALVVIPSRYEVAPIVLSEAWAVGVPVVATRVGGLQSLGEGAAVLVPPESPAALADALIQELRTDSATRERVAEGRRRAELQRAEAVAQAHIALYSELLG